MGLLGHEIRKADEAVRNVERSLPPLAEQVGCSDWGETRWENKGEKLGSLILELIVVMTMTVMFFLLLLLSNYSSYFWELFHSIEATNR